MSRLPGISANTRSSVIDKYDEVNDLEKCISPEILDLTRKADIFYLNHEYTVSEREKR